MPAMTVAQNVELPGRLAGHRPDRGRVRDALARVGLADRDCPAPRGPRGRVTRRAAAARAAG